MTESMRTGTTWIRRVHAASNWRVPVVTTRSRPNRSTGTAKRNGKSNWQSERTAKLAKSAANTMLALTGYISVRLAKRRLNRVFQLLRDGALGDQQLRQGIIINVGESAYDQVFPPRLLFTVLVRAI